MKALSGQLPEPDKFLNYLAFFGLLGCWVIPLLFYPALPDTFATHFDVYGNPNGYSSRSGIWGLPIVITVVYLVLTVAGNLPSGNKTTTLTLRREKAVCRFLQVLRLEIVLLTATSIYFIMQLATGKMEKMPIFMLPVFIGSILGTSVVYFVKIIQQEKA